MIVHCKFDELKHPKDLKNHPDNRNKHSKEQIERLAKLYDNLGIRHPIIVSQRSGYIVAGHGRKLAALRCGLDAFPVVYQNFDSEELEYAFLQSDNAIALWAELDISGIHQDLPKFEPFDLDLLGIRDFKLEPDPNNGKTDEDAIPEKVEPKAKSGQIYKLGKHYLMCGDSTDLNMVKELLGGLEVDAVITDPPYNVGVNEDSRGEEYDKSHPRNRRKDGATIMNDKMSEDDFNDFLKKVFDNYHQVMKEGAPIYVFYADSMTIPFMTKFMEAGFHFAQNCIWNKQQFVMTRKDYHYKHEPIMYGWKLGKAHPWNTDRKQSSVWNFDRPFKSELHPTMKPINILEYALKNSTKPEELVLDLFGGSGSTLIACEKNHRVCYTMELDPKFCDVIIKRFEDYSGQKAVLIKEDYTGDKVGTKAKRLRNQHASLHEPQSP